MRTIPSIPSLASALGCHAEIGPEHPDLGVLEYRVWFESEFERLELSVLPVAEEVSVALITKNPTRIVRLSLQDVCELVASVEEGKTCVSIRFHTTEVQPLHLSLGPPVILRWGNFQESTERYPPYGQDAEA